MPISVASIIRNEVQTLRKTIETVRPFVNKVVIGLDEDSTDGTDVIVKEVADTLISTKLNKELAAKAPSDPSVSADWGFSRARNLVFDACPPEDWRLVLDGHETVKNPERMQAIVDEAIKNNADGVEVMIHFEPGPDGIPALIYPQIRFMSPKVRYANPIHNVPVVERLILAHDFVIVHNKAKQAVEAKMERDIQRADANINGLKARVAESPKDARSWFYLATAYKESGIWQEAIGAFTEYLKHSVWPEERWHARTGMGISYAHLDDILNARKQFSLAIEEYPAYAEAYFYLADFAYKENCFREARVFLEACIQMPLPPKARLFVSPRIYMVDRHDKLSMVYHHLGMYKEAIEQAEIILKVAPSPRVENNIKCWTAALNQPKPGKFVSADYWEARYRNGGTSGEGSYGVYADYKAKVVNEFVEKYTVKSAIEFGCGDGNQLTLFKIPNYVGLDVSSTAINRLSDKYKEDSTKSFLHINASGYPKIEAELTLSLDVIFHLVEDDVYHNYMKALFAASTKYVIIYSSNFNQVTNVHEIERKFTEFVEKELPGWRLVEHMDNPIGHKHVKDSVYSEFFVYEKI